MSFVSLSAVTTQVWKRTSANTFEHTEQPASILRWLLQNSRWLLMQTSTRSSGWPTGMPTRLVATVRFTFDKSSLAGSVPRFRIEP